MSVEIMLSPYDSRLRVFISVKCLFCWQTRHSVFGVIELEVSAKTLQFCFDLFAYWARHDLGRLALSTIVVEHTICARVACRTGETVLVEVVRGL